MGKVDIDPREFLEKLRAEHQTFRWEPLPPGDVRMSESDHATSRSALEYLHAHWALPDASEALSELAGGRGGRGLILRLFGRLTYRVLGPYLREERELLAHMVRMNQVLDQRCDELAHSCHQLHQDMIDRQVAEAANQAKLALWLQLE